MKNNTLDINQVALLLKCSTKTIRNRIKDGTLPFVMDNGKYVIHQEDIPLEKTHWKKLKKVKYNSGLPAKKSNQGSTLSMEKLNVSMENQKLPLENSPHDFQEKPTQHTDNSKHNGRSNYDFSNGNRITDFPLEKSSQNSASTILIQTLQDDKEKLQKDVEFFKNLVVQLQDEKRFLLLQLDQSKAITEKTSQPKQTKSWWKFWE